MDIMEMSLLSQYYLWLRSWRQAWSSVMFSIAQGSLPQENLRSLCRPPSVAIASTNAEAWECLVALEQMVFAFGQ